MAKRPLHPDVANFVSSLQTLEDMLASNEQQFWANRISRVRQVAERSDGYCVQLFEGLLGGMGSFNDLILNAPTDINRAFEAEREHAIKLGKTLK